MSLKGITFRKQMAVYMLGLLVVIVGAILPSNPATAETPHNVVIESPEPGRDVKILSWPQDASFTVSTLNQRDFSENERPKVFIEDFISQGDRGDIRYATTADNYTFGASSWLSGPQELTNLGTAQDNLLTFEISPPEGLVPGSYTAVVVLGSSNQHYDQLPVIINVGEPLPLQLERVQEIEETDLKMQKIEVGLMNPSRWHVYPTVNLKLSNVADTTNVREYQLTQDKDLGILPKTQQVYSLSKSDRDELATLMKDSGWKAEITAFCDTDKKVLCTDRVHIDLPLISQAQNPERETTQQTNADNATSPVAQEPTQSARPPTASEIAKTSFWQHPVFMYTLLFGGLGLALLASLVFLRRWHESRSRFNPKASFKTLKNKKPSAPKSQAPKIPDIPLPPSPTAGLGKGVLPAQSINLPTATPPSAQPPAGNIPPAAPSLQPPAHSIPPVAPSAQPPAPTTNNIPPVTPGIPQIPPVANPNQPSPPQRATPPPQMRPVPGTPPPIAMPPNQQPATPATPGVVPNQQPLPPSGIPVPPPAVKPEQQQKQQPPKQ